MDKVTSYRRIVQELLSEYGGYKPHFPEIERQIIFDTERDHYQIVNSGWRNEERTYGCSLHLDIKNGKIWIQQNLTEIDVAGELRARGVAQEDIVLGFLSPWTRQHSEFAAA
jgi:rRNA processing protein Krr1/Pno1